MSTAPPSLCISLQGGDGHLTTQIHPVLALQRGNTRCNHAPECSHQRRGPPFGHRDRQTQLAAGRGNLRAGEPTPDHEYPAWFGGQPLLQELRVIASMHGEDALRPRLTLLAPGTRLRAVGYREAVERG